LISGYAPANLGYTIFVLFTPGFPVVSRYRPPVPVDFMGFFGEIGMYHFPATNGTCTSRDILTYISGPKE
jgi:hypothetical protein